MRSSVALITGASSGIGLELARVMASHGHDLILVARREDKLNALATELRALGRIVWVHVADLNKPDASQQIADWLQSEKIFPEILVNNAGFGDMADFQQAELDKLQEMIQVNVRVLTELTWLLLPEMVRRKKGYILNLGSTASFIPGPGMAVYHATKAYVLTLGDSLAEELRGTGVTVTTLCPGPTQSGFQEKANMTDRAIFNKISIPTAQDVAVFGYRKMLSGTRIAVHGFSNKTIPFMARFFPRSIVARIVKKVYQSK